MHTVERVELKNVDDIMLFLLEFTSSYGFQNNDILRASEWFSYTFQNTVKWVISTNDPKCTV